jgi:hypothetical protein
MEFRTEVHIPPSGKKISYRSGILFMGSCFTENIGAMMKELQFPVEVNPFGINYNPSSVARNLWSLLNGKEFREDDLDTDGDRWFSFDHHSRFSHPDREVCLQKINDRLGKAHRQLKDTRFLLLTWGTAWVYVHKKKACVVSNCHKLPAADFSRHLLTMNQIIDTCTKLFAALRKEIPDLHIILSVSPVRHWKDGPRLNSVSKSTLLLAAHGLTEMFSYCDYFPAWEIAMDDLRDYRYYADDLVHPNTQMTRYIWEKFSGAWFDGETLDLIPEIRRLSDARNHRPFDPGSKKYLDFCKKQLDVIRKLAGRYPFLNLSELEEHFTASLTKP